LTQCSGQKRVGQRRSCFSIASARAEGRIARESLARAASCVAIDHFDNSVAGRGRPGTLLGRRRSQGQHWLVSGGRPWQCWFQHWCGRQQRRVRILEPSRSLSGAKIRQRMCHILRNSGSQPVLCVVTCLQFKNCLVGRLHAWARFCKMN